MDSLKSVEDALSWIAKLPHGTPKAIFRGQTQQWPLLPNLFRDKPIDGLRRIGFKSLQARILELFESRAYPFLSVVVPQTELDWLVLAQHHGCQTRLLDWTGNPLWDFSSLPRRMMAPTVFSGRLRVLIGLPMTPQTRCLAHSQKHSFTPQSTLLRGSPRKPPVSRFTLSRMTHAVSRHSKPERTCSRRSFGRLRPASPLQDMLSMRSFRGLVRKKSEINFIC